MLRTFVPIRPVAFGNGRFFQAQCGGNWPGKTIKLVVIPSQYGIDIFDTKFLIYTNTIFHTSSMICPDANREDIKEEIE